ncbi:MAG: glycosyltransferase family 2 protein [Smithella sp.]
MTQSLYRFGKFFIYTLNTSSEFFFLDSIKKDIIEIKKFSSFLRKQTSSYLLVISAEKEVKIETSALRRLIQIAEDSQAGLVYSDYFLESNGAIKSYPLIDYQPGSVRDDFNFGDVFIFSTDAVKNAQKKYGTISNDPALALYDLRLKISLDYPIFHIPEFLYFVADKAKVEGCKCKNEEETHFAYVAARNLAKQKNLEKVATNFLKLNGAYLPRRTKKASSPNTFFPVQASIVIPVLNRKNTIADALQSVLAQKANFDFNIIVVDNHSTDGTSKIIRDLAKSNPKIEHLIPSRTDLSIGGCWNEAIYSSCCGKYVIQLDSDDLYSTDDTLQTIVDLLVKGHYAMVVASYTIVNEQLQKIPPGLIDHREWTDTNGHNNVLRINGLGAPRAFNTSVLRQIGFPNVGYGEDYAVALRISREYKIGRIYQSLYLCRRWADNTDAALSAEKQNRNDFYKDKLRTLEIKTRQQMNLSR